MTPFHIEARRKRHARARRFADCLRSGMSVREVADQSGLTPARIYQILSEACPPFFDCDDVPATKPAIISAPKSEPVRFRDERPDWSYPDEITLRIVREARADMEKTPTPPLYRISPEAPPR